MSEDVKPATVVDLAQRRQSRWDNQTWACSCGSTIFSLPRSGIPICVKCEGPADRVRHIVWEAN